MVNRSLRLAHTALALFAALLGFLFLHSFESYVPVGPDWYVDVVRPAQDKAPFSEVDARVEVYVRDRRRPPARTLGRVRPFAQAGADLADSGDVI